eukprot:11202741-Lingulodinium_polyedra.AAC.1
MRREKGDRKWWAWCRVCDCWAEASRVAGSKHHQKYAPWHKPPAQSGTCGAAAPCPPVSPAPSEASVEPTALKPPRQDN